MKEIPDVIGYPPRLLITARTNSDFTSPRIEVDGLDRECGFNLLMPFAGKSGLMIMMFTMMLVHPSYSCSAAAID